MKTIDIEIINDHMFEKDETFMVELTEVKTEGAKLGRLRRTVVTIVSDDGKIEAYLLCVRPRMSYRTFVIGMCHIYSVSLLLIIYVS